MALRFLKLEFIFKLKIKHNDLRVRKQPIIVIYFEFETVLKFYILEAIWYPGSGVVFDCIVS